MNPLPIGKIEASIFTVIKFIPMRAIFSRSVLYYVWYERQSKGYTNNLMLIIILKFLLLKLEQIHEIFHWLQIL